MLVVDLDHSLIRTDLLYETLFAGLAENPIGTLKALPAILQGRAALKRALALAARPRIAALPLNEVVVDVIHAARGRGERVVLVSASDDILVQQVAEGLGLFDEAHGSTPGRNLKGKGKAEFLAERFGARGFDYVGDSTVDVNVWRQARRAITVGATSGLRRKAEAAALEAEHVDPPPSALGKLSPYIETLRPHQWLKNMLVFVPPIAAHVASFGVLLSALIAFVCFSLTASSVYILNDLLDLSADRAHPRKRFRPFASGRIPIRHGMFLAPTLLITAFALALLTLPPEFAAVMFVYYVSTTAYSLLLKRKLVIDVITLAGLYTLRVMAGGMATGLPISPWTLAFFGFLFLSLAAMKRQTELVDGLRNGRDKASGRAYEVEDLPIVAMMAISSGYVSVLVLALYASTDTVRALYSSPLMLWTACPILLYWISRLVMMAHRGRMDDDPLVFAMRDPISLTCAGFVLLIGAAGNYL